MLTPALGAVSLAGTPHVNHVNPFASGLLRVRQKPCKLETPKPYFAAQCVETSRSRPGAVVLGFVFRLGADPSKFQRRKHESLNSTFTLPLVHLLLGITGRGQHPRVYGSWQGSDFAKWFRVQGWGLKVLRLVEGTFACWPPQAFLQIFMP